VLSVARRTASAQAFSSQRCARALGAILAGLTLWVGLWDLVDVHLLPNVFETCQDEPTVGCALVKVGLAAIGGLGLYCTRSLYGDVGRPENSQVQFSRIA